MVDYYNEQRKEMFIFEQEAREDAKKATREGDIIARNEDAVFWRAEQNKTRKAEDEDRKAMADFWLNYRKEVQKISQANAPSNLNFGLL